MKLTIKFKKSLNKKTYYQNLSQFSKNQPLRRRIHDTDPIITKTYWGKEAYLQSLWNQGELTNLIEKALLDVKVQNLSTEEKFKVLCERIEEACNMFFSSNQQSKFQKKTCLLVQP